MLGRWLGILRKVWKRVRGGGGKKGESLVLFLVGVYIRSVGGICFRFVV